MYVVFFPDDYPVFCNLIYIKSIFLFSDNIEGHIFLLYLIKENEPVSILVGIVE
jgi:hypothetical protein